MTRQEAKEILQGSRITSFRPNGTVRVKEALNMAIEALSNRPTDEWCTDCKEYDHEKHCCPRFNRVIRTTLDEVVRCKDCRYRKKVGTSYYCELDEFNVKDTDFCSWGERKETLPQYEEWQDEFNKMCESAKVGDDNE